MRSVLPALVLLLACSAAQALTQDEVAAGSAQLYRKRIAELDSGHKLDPDPKFLARVQRVAGVLIAQAGRDNPATLQWQWEVHTSNEAGENADCMAGGKLLVSQTYVHELELSDSELAMLLAHEIVHATELHNLKEFEEAMRLDPAWRARPFAELEDAVDNDRALMRKLAAFDFAQEVQADLEGMKLAWRAGWPAKELAKYFKKAANASHHRNFETDSHPSPASRWRAAQELAATMP
jgi:predicted Zn-dependent protease